MLYALGIKLQLLPNCFVRTQLTKDRVWSYKVAVRDLTDKGGQEPEQEPETFVPQLCAHIVSHLAAPATNHHRGPRNGSTWYQSWALVTRLSPCGQPHAKLVMRTGQAVHNGRVDP